MFALNRRALMRMLGTAGASPLVGKIQLPVESAAALPKGPPLPLTDLLLRIIKPDDWQRGNARVELLTPTIYRLVEKVRKYGVQESSTQESFGHVRSTVYGEDYVDAMLGDPLGRAKLVEKWRNDTYYPSVGYVGDFEKIGKALLADGRTREGLLFKRAARAGRIYEQIEESFCQERSARSYSPRLYKLMDEVRRAQPWEDISLDEYPKKMLEASREYRRVIERLRQFKPRKRDKGWWDEFYAEYSQIKAHIASQRKWGEHRWLRDILAEQRRRWRWTVGYKRRRFEHFSRELTTFREIRDRVLAALVEHANVPIVAQGPYSNIGVETCLRVIRRLDVLMTVPMEAITFPPHISPVDVAASMVGAAIRKMFKEVLE